MFYVSVVNVCEAPPDPVNGDYINRPEENSAVGTVLNITCDAGYYSPVDASQISCHEPAAGHVAEWIPIPVPSCRKS